MTSTARQVEGNSIIVIHNHGTMMTDEGQLLVKGTRITLLSRSSVSVINITHVEADPRHKLTALAAS